MKKNFGYLFTGAGMLAVCSVIAKLLGAMYRIPLTNVLGGEGMGLYQMVFPLYTLLLTVSSGGLPVAISRLIAVKLADDDERGASKILSVSVVALSVVGAIGTALLALTRGLVARMQGNPSASVAYLGISPAVTLVAVLSCYRGYFQGRENMLPSALSQLVEQAVKLFLGLYFARLFLSRGVEYAVFGALLGVSVSEFLAMAGLIVTYVVSSMRRKKNLAHVARREMLNEVREDMTFFRGVPDGRADELFEPRSQAARRGRIKSRDRRRAAMATPQDQPNDTVVTMGADSDFAGDMTAELGLSAAGASLKSSCKREVKQNVDSVGAILRAIVGVALPVTFGSLVLPLTQLVDSVLIINILSALGFSAQQATMAYGLVGGTVMTLVNVPVVVIFAFSAVLLPKIAKACSDRETVAREAGFSLKLCSALGLVMFLFMFVYAEPLVRLLYSRGLSESQLQLCAKLLKLSGFTIFYVSIVQVCTAVLQGLNLSGKPARNLFFGAIVKVALTAGLLYAIGIFGAVVGSIGCYALTAILDLVSVRREVPLRLDVRKSFVPVVAAAAFLAVGYLTSRAFASLSPLLLLLSSVPIAAVAFLAVIFGLRWFELWEIKRMIPFLR